LKDVSGFIVDDLNPSGQEMKVCSIVLGIRNFGSLQQGFSVEAQNKDGREIEIMMSSLRTSSFPRQTFLAAFKHYHSSVLGPHISTLTDVID